MIFASTKFIAFRDKTDTNFSSYTKVGEQTPDFSFGQEDGFQIAFSLTDYATGIDAEAFFDETYGAFEFEYTSWTTNEKGGYETSRELVPLHRCQDSDLKKFYPAEKEL